MSKFKKILGIAVVGTVCTVAHAVEFRGQTDAGARYLIKAPDGWRSGDPLVVVNHGFQFEKETGDPSLGSVVLRNYWEQRGYAIAASGYSTHGWATFTAEVDTEQLMSKVRASIGQPGKVFTTGGSLGGLISLQQAELAAAGRLPSLPRVDGVLSLCPPLAGSRVWDKAIDFRVSYDQICTGSNALPNGPAATPWLMKPRDVDNGGSTSAYAEVALSASRCLGLEVPSALQTSGMRERRELLKKATQASDEFLATLLFYSTFAMSDLVYDAKKLGGSLLQPFDTRGVDFFDQSLNTSVRRLQADPLGRLGLMSNYQPSGQIGNAKLLTITTSQDGLVVPEHLRFLESKTPTNQWARALINESTPSHCGFNDTELLQSFKQLEAWVAGAEKPSVPALNQACTSCRFASAENLQDISQVLPERKNLLLESTVRVETNGDWFNSARSGEGIKVEALADGRATVTFFTYPTVGESSEQLWITGTGRIVQNGIVVDDAFRTSGAKFGSAFTASDVRLERWGSMQFALGDCGKGAFSYRGPAGYGNGTVEMTQLTRQGVPCFSRQALSAFTAFSGSWYDPTRSGEGINVTVQNNGSVALIWYSYAPDSRQAWFAMQGNFLDLGTRGSTAGVLYRPIGARFGADFRANDVQVQSFGNAEIRFENCDRAVFSANTPWGTQTLNLVRLAAPLDAATCPR